VLRLADEVTERLAELDEESIDEVAADWRRTEEFESEDWEEERSTRCSPICPNSPASPIRKVRRCSSGCTRCAPERQSFTGLRRNACADLPPRAIHPQRTCASLRRSICRSSGAVAPVRGRVFLDFCRAGRKISPPRSWRRHRHASPGAGRSPDRGCGRNRSQLGLQAPQIVAADRKPTFQHLRRLQDHAQGMQRRLPGDGEQYPCRRWPTGSRCGPVDTSPLAKVGFDSVSSRGHRWPSAPPARRAHPPPTGRGPHRPTGCPRRTADSNRRARSWLAEQAVRAAPCCRE